jgi:hypothetical protein
MDVEVEVFSDWPRLRTLPPPHPYGNQRLQRQFDGLLMMGIVMPETCWAVSVRQSNKILRLIIASSWVFYLSYVDHSHTMYSSGNIDVWNWVHLFEFCVCVCVCVCGGIFVKYAAT